MGPIPYCTYSGPLPLKEEVILYGPKEVQNICVLIKTGELTSRKTQQHIKVQRARVQRFL